MYLSYRLLRIVESYSSRVMAALLLALLIDALRGVLELEMSSQQTIFHFPSFFSSKEGFFLGKKNPRICGLIRGPVEHV